MDRFDVIVMGMGPGGEAAAGRLLDAGRHVAVIEQELIGGECAYWACIPSKTLLRSPEAQAEAARAAGVATPTLDWPQLRGYRDYMIRHLDDSGQARDYEQAGATVIRGTARLAGQGRVDVDGRQLEAGHIVIATGSQPLRPAVDGLGGVTVWTNREATTGWRVLIVLPFCRYRPVQSLALAAGRGRDRCGGRAYGPARR